MTTWGTDAVCGGINWMYPDVDPRKNAITTLEAVQAAAQLSVALKWREPVRAATNQKRALRLWAFFEDVHLFGPDHLVHDNVTGTAHGKFHCCNSTTAPLCEPRDTITWSYNQGMYLGAVVDLHALTHDVSYLRSGSKLLDAVISTLTRDDSSQPSGNHGAGGGAATVLREPKSVGLTIHDRKCDASHDPSASAGGDLFSFKGVFFQQLPRFVKAAKVAGVLTDAQLAAARKLVADSADAAWRHRVTPPFPKADICNEFSDPPLPADGPPKFTWDWKPPPSGGALTCMDARTQAQALSVFVADYRLSEQFI